MRRPMSKILLSFFIAACVLFGMWAVNAGPASATPVAQASDDWTPSDGFRSNGKCYSNVAHVGVVEQDCGDWQPVPEPIRQCAAATGIATLSAWFFAAPLLAAASSTAAGCLAGVF